MDSFDHDGVFWLPDRENDQRTGRLKFDPVEGATLELIGAFGDIKDQFNPEPGTLRIHGVAGKRYLTLDHCFMTNSTFEMPGIMRQTYYVGRIVTNHLFGQDELLTFDKCSVSFDQLATWVRRSGVSVKLEAPTKTQTPNRINIEFNEQQDEVAAVEDDEELRLRSTWALGGDNITETHLRQGSYLQVSYPEALPLEDALDDVKHLQDLLTLTTAAPAVPLEITLWRKDITREMRPGESRPQDMSFYAGQLAEKVRLGEAQSPGHVLFQFQDIGGLPTIARWVKVARKYKTVTGSLLSIRYASGLYVENRFHNVISAAETFHRLRFSNEVMSKQEFKRFCRRLIRAVPKDDRNWLGNQLQYSNEPRLRHRLEEMATFAGEAFATVHPDADTWVTVVAESRNRLIHHDEEQSIDFQPGDLYFLTESVFTLVMICLFRECAVPDTTLAAVGNSGNIRFLRGKLAEIIPRLFAQVGRR
jgi:hypothetical protein